MYPHIRTAKILPVDTIEQSDHLEIVMDVSIHALSNYELPTVSTFKQRKLKSDHPKRLAKYTKILSEKIKSHHLEIKIDTLLKATLLNNRDISIPNQYDLIDYRLRQCQLEAEKDCTHSKGKYPWSPTLHACGLKLRCINSMIRQTKMGYPWSRAPNEYIQTYYPHWTTLSLKELIGLQNSCLSQLRYIQKNAYHYRYQFLNMLAESHPLASTMSKRLIIKRICQREARRNQFAKIKRYMLDNSNFQVNNIIIDTPDGESIISDPVDMTNMIIENIIHTVSPTNNSLPTKQEFISKYGRYGQH